MGVLVGLLSIIVSGIIKNALNLNGVQGEVVHVSVVFRHGDRNIITPYGNDPNKDRSNWPEGFGQLTNIGKRQEYALGQWLRSRYDHLLSQRYDRDLVRVRSTDVDRTLMSAQCVLAGMFPPKGQQQWNSGLNWQPIPVHTVPEVLDKVLASKYPCPAYQQEYQRLMNSSEVANIIARYSELMKFLSENAGQNVTTLEDINLIYHDLYIESHKNLTIPSWAPSLFPKMAEASSYCFALPAWNTKLARLKKGPLVQELLNSMQAKKDKKSSLNVNLYSAHDNTISYLMTSLGVFELQVPPTAAAFMVELRGDSGGAGGDRYSVALFYRNSTDVDPYQLTVPGCSPECPLEQLIDLTRPLIPADWDHECQV